MFDGGRIRLASARKNVPAKGSGDFCNTGSVGGQSVFKAETRPSFASFAEEYPSLCFVEHGPFVLG